MKALRRPAALAAVSCALLGAAAPSAAAHQRSTVPRLDWSACGDAPGVQCTTARVPLDYDHPHGRSISLFVARSSATDPAHRIGTLFFNFGGPGGTAADSVEAAGADVFPALGGRFDIVGMDPRGVGQSTPSIDCRANQETQGIYSQPFTTPFNLDVGALLAKDRGYIDQCLAQNPSGILSHVSTANVARDIDLLRRAMGDAQISYLGFSYGTFLGATYASLFPSHYRAMVLDGPVDANAYVNDPLRALSSQSSAFERALGRFFQACAAHQDACLGFGGDDPWSAYDELVDHADATPLPADGYTPDPRPVDGDDIRFGTALGLYAKQFWPLLAEALSDAAQGDGSLLRLLTDAFYGRLDDGSYDPSSDRYFTIGATEQRYPRDLGTYLAAGLRSWNQHEHFYWNNGYTELNYGLWPARDRDAFDGPFRIPGSAVTPLVVATRYDPATPYRGALDLAGDLGNARLLKMIGDGHTAYSGNSSCVDAAVEAYLEELTLPAPGTTCRQEVPFAQATAAAQARSSSGASVRRASRLLRREMRTVR
jgi:pimeloyl-ACP methyl ester carboxylesterase